MPQTTDTTRPAAAGQPERLELTRERFAELESLVKRLRDGDRPALERQLQRAALFLDPKIAPDMVAVARYDLRVLDARITEIEDQLKRAVVVAPPLDPTDVELGTAVTVRYDDGSEEVLTIVPPTEGGESQGAVANTSAAGQALLKKRPGDRVTVDGVDGEKITVRIVSVKAADSDTANTDTAEG